MQETLFSLHLLSRYCVWRYGDYPIIALSHYPQTKQSFLHLCNHLIQSALSVILTRRGFFESTLYKPEDRFLGCIRSHHVCVLECYPTPADVFP